MFLALNLVLKKKQKFGECDSIEHMGETKEINIKNRTYCFYNDQNNLKDFDAKLLKVDKKLYNEIDIYYIGYVTIKKIVNCNNINSVNTLY